MAAISKSGTHGYSQPTELFILSSPPKPPSQPQNLTVSKVYASASAKDRVDADVSWIPSKRSDLPISNYKITWSMLGENRPHHGGQDLVEAQNLNKYTIHNLHRDATYAVEIAAQSEHEQSMLVSAPTRASLDTTLSDLESFSLQLKADTSTRSSMPLAKANSNDYDDDDDEEDEDLDARPMTRNSHQQIAASKRPIIKNLLVSRV